MLARQAAVASFSNSDTRPDGQFRDAYVLADFNGREEDRRHQEASWRAKHVTPILFKRLRGKDPFRLLNDTLTTWAAQYIGGIGSRIDEALKLGRKPYIAAGGAYALG